MKAIAIARVSSDEQEVDGQSLSAQTDRLLRYIQEKDLQLIHEPFQLVESSTKGKRKEFNKIINDSLLKDEVLAIVVERVDRLQRSFKESIFCQELIEKNKIELHFASDRLIINIDSPGQDIMRWDYSVIGAKQYVLAISDNVKRTFEFKLKKGEAIGKLPIGYLNIQEDDGKGGTVGKGIIDPQRAYLIQKGFELYSTGTYSYRSLAKELRRLGLTKNTKKGGLVDKKDVERFIHNPIYYGMQEIKGVKYPHYFGNIISKELFDKCQEIIDGKRVEQTRPDNNIPYIFRGLIRCGKCGRLCSPYKGKLQNYVRCTQPKDVCSNLNVPERVLLKQLEDVFKNLVIPEGIMEELLVDIKNTHEGKKIFENEQKEGARKLIDRYQKNLDELLDMRLDKSITQEQYDKKATELRSKITEQNEILNRFPEADKNFADLMIKLLNISTHAWDIFQSSSIDKKRELLGLITLNLTLDDKKIYVELQKPFDAIYNYNKTGKWGGRWDLNPQPSVPQTDALTN